MSLHLLHGQCSRTPSKWKGHYRVPACWHLVVTCWPLMKIWQKVWPKACLISHPTLSPVNQIINPLSPRGDQQRFSPNNFDTLTRNKVMRINKIITKEKVPWSFFKFSRLILKGNEWRSVWRIRMFILGLEGLTARICGQGSQVIDQSDQQPEHNTINWRDTTHFDSEDDNRTGCRNVSHCQQQQSYSGLRSPGWSNSTYFWNDSWIQTFHSHNLEG